MLDKNVFSKGIKILFIQYNFTFNNDEEKKIWLYTGYNILISKKVDNETFISGINYILFNCSKEDFKTRPSINDIYEMGILKILSKRYILENYDKFKDDWRYGLFMEDKREKIQEELKMYSSSNYIKLK